MARSSVSLLPASVSAGLPVEGRSAGSSETVTGAAAGSSVEADGWGVVRGRVAEATRFAGCARCAVGWDEVNLAKSSRMFRAASQPDRSNRPTATVCFTKLLIVIPPT
jgi:hypothetical protein